MSFRFEHSKLANAIRRSGSHLRDLPTVIRATGTLTLVLTIACLGSGCSLIGLGIGAAVDSQAIITEPLTTDTLSSLSVGDTIRVCTRQVRGMKKYERAVFESYDAQAGVIHGRTLKRETEPVQYEVAQLLNVDRIHKAQGRNSGKIIGLSAGLAIDVAVIAVGMSSLDFDFMDGWNSEPGEHWCCP